MNGTNYEVTHSEAFSTSYSHGSKYSHLDPVFYTFSLHSFLNVKDNVSRPPRATSNITVLFHIIFNLREI